MMSQDKVGDFLKDKNISHGEVWRYLNEYYPKKAGKSSLPPSVERWHEIDQVLNKAGIGRQCLCDWLTEEEWQATYAEDRRDRERREEQIDFYESHLDIPPSMDEPGGSDWKV